MVPAVGASSSVVALRMVLLPLWLRVALPPLLAMLRVPVFVLGPPLRLSTPPFNATWFQSGVVIAAKLAMPPVWLKVLALLMVRVVVVSDPPERLSCPVPAAAARKLCTVRAALGPDLTLAAVGMNAA